MAGTVIVHGFAQIQRDIERSGKDVGTALRMGLRQAAEPTAHLAQGLSLARIGEHHGHKMAKSPQWAEVRIGVTRSAVYIVPKKKGVKSHNPFDPRRRPNLVELMMRKSFTPALNFGAPFAEAAVIRLLERFLR